MDMTQYENGTIFDNIIKINEEMTKKLKVKMDLREPSSLSELDKDGGKIDVAKQLEYKLDGYIVEFVNLNNRN